MTAATGFTYIYRKW